MGSSPAYVTVLVGDDSISREKEKRDLVAVIDSIHDDVERQVYDSDRQTIGQLVEQVLTPSLFHAVRIFFIRHADLLSEAELEDLTRLLDYDIPDAYLVIEADESAKKTRGVSKVFTVWLKNFKTRQRKQPERFVLRSFLRPPDYKIAEWLVSNIPSMLGRRITKRDAEYFVDLVGYDFDTIYSEIQKIDIYLAEGEPIDRKIITEVIEGSRVMNAFELAQALGKKDLVRALEIIDSLFSTNFYASSCIWVIFRHFWALFRIRCFRTEHPKEFREFQQSVRAYNRAVQDRIGLQIGKAAGLLAEGQENRIYPVIIKSGILEQACSFGESHLKTIFGWLRDFDIGTKTGRVENSKRAFQLLCYRIARAAEVASA